jgi:NADPH-dependent glutamate synthase beta subunit-like oxidoreductase
VVAVLRGVVVVGPMMRRDVALVPDLSDEPARAGPVRSRRPVYVDLLPPCNAACQAGENIQSWLAEVEAGRHEQAWRQVLADNPFPAVEGRVCYHPCETSCNRAELDEAVSIHAVERFLGDRALEEGWELPAPATRSGKRVLVVGAGPSGLSAAYHLARAGHDVEIHDAGPEPGGMMRYGIPAYRLPRDVLDAELARITALGVRIVSGQRVTDLEAERHDGRFDAVFVAVGAQLSKRVDIPARDAGRILDAVSFLKEVAEGERPMLGRKVAVYGGGDTAMDAARTARRLGADEALVVYRRTRAQMPAHEEEVEEAEREGVRMNWLRTISGFEGTALVVEAMELDEHGVPHPTGRLERLEADSLILALGQDTDTGFLRSVPGVEFTHDGTVVVSPSMMTGAAGIFAGGDMVPAERTVTVGVGHGKKAARHISAWLAGGAVASGPKHDLAGFEKLHLWYFGDFARRAQPELAPDERVADFSEVVGGLGASEAAFEAARCLSCGNCFECDGCLGACPEDAVIKLGPGRRYRFDYDRCTGCAACFEQCPVHAIEMVPEPGTALEAR